MGFFSKMFGSYSDRELKSIYPIVDKIEAMADEYKAMSDAELQAKTPEFKTRLQCGETLDDILPEVLAEVKPFEAQFGHSIPVFVAGGVYTGAALAHFTRLCAAGVQLATR